MLLFTTAGEYHILLTQLDLLHGIAYTMGAGGAGGRDGIVDALDLEGGCEAGGSGAAHGLGHSVGSDPLEALVAQDVRRFDQVKGGCPARSHDDAGALVGHLGFIEPGVVNRLLHGHIGKGRGVAHEAQEFAVDQFLQVDVDGAGYFAAESPFLVSFLKFDSRAPRTQGLQHGGYVITQTGDNSHSGNYNAFHRQPLIVTEPDMCKLK
jgi:hypothetical protein